MKLRKTGAKTTQDLISTRDFGLNPKYCGKPVQDFTYLKDHRVIWRKTRRETRVDMGKLEGLCFGFRER